MADRQNIHHHNETNRDLPLPNPMPPPAAGAAPADDADDQILAGALESARDMCLFRTPDTNPFFCITKEQNWIIEQSTKF